MNWLTAVWVSVICHQLIPSIPEEPAMEEELLSSAVQRQCCTLGSPSTQHVALLPAGTSHLTWPLFSMGKQNTVCSFRVKKKKKMFPFCAMGWLQTPWISWFARTWCFVVFPAWKRSCLGSWEGFPSSWGPCPSQLLGGVPQTEGSNAKNAFGPSFKSWRVCSGSRGNTDL